MSTENRFFSKVDNVKPEEQAALSSKLTAEAFQKQKNIPAANDLPADKLIACTGSFSLFTKKRSHQVNAQTVGRDISPPNGSSNKNGSNYSYSARANGQAHIEALTNRQKQQKDQTTLSVLSDGTKLYSYSNGGKIFIGKDGNKVAVTQNKDGTIIQDFNDGKALRFIYSNKTSIERSETSFGKKERAFDKDGKLIKTAWFDKNDKELATATLKSNGNIIQKFPDNSSREISPDGSYTEKIADGSNYFNMRSFNKDGTEQGPPIPPTPEPPPAIQSVLPSVEIAVPTPPIPQLPLDLPPPNPAGQPTEAVVVKPVEPAKTEAVVVKPVEPAKTEAVVVKPVEPAKTEAVVVKPVEPAKTEAVVVKPVEPAKTEAVVVKPVESPKAAGEVTKSPESYDVQLRPEPEAKSQPKSEKSRSPSLRDIRN